MKFKCYCNSINECNCYVFENEVHYMSLDFTSRSLELDEFLSRLCEEISLTNFKKNKQNQKRKAALEAICADVMLALSHNSKGWAFRSIRRDAFSGQRIGFRAFDRALKALLACGYLSKTRSVNQATVGGWEFRAPRIRPTGMFLALMDKHGIKPGDRSHVQEVHFIPKVLRPITLRAGSIREGKDKFKGRLMKISSSLPIVKRHKEQMDQINGFLADYRLTLAGDPANALRCKGLHRIFNCGDKIGHGYRKGGRLYAVSGDYQALAGKTPDDPKKVGLERKYLLIDGEEVVEIDVGASHPRILLAMLDQPISDDIDPYDFEGIPRKIVKTWFTMTMGHHKFHKAWKPDTRNKYAEANPGRDLSKDHPIKKVQAAVLARFPALAAWDSCPIRWGDLQYTESQVIAETVYRLGRTYGIPAYPVHDSIIVPASKAGVAEWVLREVFKDEVGVYPALSVKGA